MANELLPVVFTPEFKRNLRHLSKKYRHIRSDIGPIIEQLSAGRAANSEARKGKSGGY